MLYASGFNPYHDVHLFMHIARRRLGGSRQSTPRYARSSTSLLLLEGFSHRASFFHASPFNIIHPSIKMSRLRSQPLKYHLQSIQCKNASNLPSHSGCPKAHTQHTSPPTLHPAYQFPSFLALPPPVPTTLTPAPRSGRPALTPWTNPKGLTIRCNLPCSARCGH